ncbi:MAG TPA: hypothetical protein VHG28_04670, partial [Longimicrobiaceae bacterium]|nr:hypothetical protein [Longimicrobiaceae bacterium]
LGEAMAAPARPAGWTLWSGMQARGEAATRSELRQLRAQVDSLRALVSAPDTAGVLPADSTPAAASPVNPSPRSPNPR